MQAFFGISFVTLIVSVILRQSTLDPESQAPTITFACGIALFAIGLALLVRRELKGAMHNALLVACCTAAAIAVHVFGEPEFFDAAWNAVVVLLGTQLGAMWNLFDMLSGRKNFSEPRPSTNPGMHQYPHTEVSATDNRSSYAQSDEPASASAEKSRWAGLGAAGVAGAAAAGVAGMAFAHAKSNDDWLPSSSHDSSLLDSEMFKPMGPIMNIDGTPMVGDSGFDIKGNPFGVTESPSSTDNFGSGLFNTDSFVGSSSFDSFSSSSDWSSGGGFDNNSF